MDFSCQTVNLQFKLHGKMGKDREVSEESLFYGDPEELREEIGQ